MCEYLGVKVQFMIKISKNKVSLLKYKGKIKQIEVNLYI